MPGEASTAGAVSDASDVIGLAGVASDSLSEDAILDQPSDVAAAVAEPAEAEAPAGKTAEEGAPAEGADGKPAAELSDAVVGAIPKELNALFKDPQVGPKLQTVRPMIQSAFDQLARIREVFPTVRSVHEFASAFPGGIEEAKAAAEKAQLLDAGADEFKGGPEAQLSLANEWHEDDPEAFQSMFLQSAKVLSERDPEAYSRITDSVFHERMSKLGFDEQIEGFRHALAKGDTDRLKGLVQWMVNEADKVGIKYAKAAGQPDPTITAAQREREAATAEKDTARKERVDLFQTNVDTEVRSTMVKSISQITSPLLKDSAFSDSGKQKISSEISTVIEQALLGDRNLQRQLNQIAAEGFRTNKVKEAQRQVADLIASRGKKLVPETSKKVIEEWTARLVSSNKDANTRKTAAGNRTDVGAGGAAPAVRTRKLTPQDAAGMTDDQIMDA